MKLTKAVAEFIKELEPSKAKATRDGYASDLNHLASMARPDSVLTFNEALATTYFLALSSQNQAMSTLHRKRASVSQFAEWGVRKGLWPKNPLAGNPMFRFRKPVSIPRPYTRDEIERLLALPLIGVEKVFRSLLYFTGLRVTPICEILISNVNLGVQEIDVDVNGERQRITIHGTVRTVGKGNKPHIVPVVAELAAVLGDWLRERPGRGHEWLVRQGNGRPFRRKTVERMTAAWGEAAGVADCIPHRWRHTYATDLLAKGTDIRVIQRLLGHDSIQSTLVYTKVSDAQAFAAVLRARTA
jgi:site-specific recombinase XerD